MRPVRRPLCLAMAALVLAACENSTRLQRYEDPLTLCIVVDRTSFRKQVEQHPSYLSGWEYAGIVTVAILINVMLAACKSNSQALGFPVSTQLELRHLNSKNRIDERHTLRWGRNTFLVERSNLNGLWQLYLQSPRLGLYSKPFIIPNQANLHCLVEIGDNISLSGTIPVEIKCPAKPREPEQTPHH